LPSVKTSFDGFDDDNFKPLKSLNWQVHVYGDVGLEIRAICEQRRLPLHVFGWQRDMGRSGLQRDAVYLVRPDGYVAMVDREGRPRRSRPISTRTKSSDWIRAERLR
jgi:hypothetical protein